MTTFNPQTDYKEKFAEETKKLIDLKIEDREIRMEAVDTLINDYIEVIGERPPQSSVFLLTNYILSEELSDKSQNKSILGKKAIERRQMMETSLDDVSEYIGSDRKKKDIPTRRKRSKYENMVMDGQLKANPKAKQG